jgi:hypothetical protein
VYLCLNNPPHNDIDNQPSEYVRGQGQRSDSLTPHVSFSTVFQSACGKRLWILKLTRETSLRTGLSSLSQLLSKETKLSKLTLLLIS